MSDYFSELRDELVDAAGRERVAKPASSHQPGRRKRFVAIAALALVGVATPAAALVIEATAEPDGLVRLGPRTELASGVLADQRAWTLVGGPSRAGFCLGIRLPVAPDVPDTATYEGCGGGEPGGLRAAMVGNDSSRSRTVVYGMTSEETARVEVRSAQGTSIATIIEDERELAGQLFVALLPTEALPDTATVTAYADSGSPIDAVRVGPGEAG